VTRDAKVRDLVLSRRGTVLAHSDPARVLGRASDEPGLAATFARWHDAGSPIDTVASSELSQDHLVSMAGIPWSDWVLVRLVPRTAALEPMAAARRAAGLAAFAAGLLSALLAGAVAWTAVRPIGQLRDRAERMLAGHAASADDWPRQSGEIGAMSQAFRLLLQMQERQRGEMQAHRDRLSWAASHDLLTGLVNRAAFEVLLETATAQAADAPFCMLFIDLDRFKQVNDTSGHAAGDALLRGVAQALAARLRKSDTVARLGGDEFAALLPQCPPAQAQALAEKLRSAVEDFRLEWEGTRHSVGASIGMVAADGTHTSAAEVLRAADAACYRAKRAGRNQVALAEA
jgi:diguanylate cyclase (GGDEF)-like protein